MTLPKDSAHLFVNQGSHVISTIFILYGKNILELEWPCATEKQNNEENKCLVSIIIRRKIYIQQIFRMQSH